MVWFLVSSQIRWCNKRCTVRAIITIIGRRNDAIGGDGVDPSRRHLATGALIKGPQQQTLLRHYWRILQNIIWFSDLSWFCLVFFFIYRYLFLSFSFFFKTGWEGWEELEIEREKKIFIIKIPLIACAWNGDGGSRGGGRWNHTVK